nr:MAG TPA: hypothetical protein [Caudoviricetes sp.]
MRGDFSWRCCGFLKSSLSRHKCIYFLVLYQNRRCEG